MYIAGIFTIAGLLTELPLTIQVQLSLFGSAHDVVVDDWEATEDPVEALHRQGEEVAGGHGGDRGHSLPTGQQADLCRRQAHQKEEEGMCVVCNSPLCRCCS